jgi:glucosamine--fructose-6-phosphate aminotransferase (isomerizing)
MLKSARAEVEAAAAAIRARRPAALLIAARGSSDHAATYAKYLFETRNRMPVTLAAPSVFSLYHQPPRLSGLAVVAISQSGASPDVVGVLEEGRRQGSVTIAITGEPRSRLGRVAEHIVQLRGGPELSVPASKTYTASLLAIALLSQALDPEPGFDSSLDQVPAALTAALGMESHLDVAAALIRGARLAVLGRGYNLATALEIGLKLMETSYVVAESRSVADFMHGPIATVEPGFPIILIEATGPTLRQMRNLGRRVEAAGARVLTITDHPAGSIGQALSIRTGLPETLTPLPYVIAGQLLALRMAQLLGIDSDRPRGLKKITETR